MTKLKLYTEEELERAMDLANRNVNKKSIIESLTPIELPSDEEIENWANKDLNNFYKDSSFMRGVKYVIDKIQGGNNEQQ